MGLFASDFKKPGPGISKNAPEKHRFFLFFELLFNNFANLVEINILYALCALPLIFGIFMSVTFNRDIHLFTYTNDIIGLALLIISVFTTFPITAGYTYVLRNLQRREHAWIIRDIFKHTKANYKNAAINGLVQIVVYYVLYGAFFIYKTAFGGSIGFLSSWIVIVMTLVFVWMQFYVNTMMVTFDLTLKQIYQNALFFSVGKIFTNVLITAICGGIIFLLAYLWAVMPYIAIFLIALFAFSLLGFITVFCVYPHIDKYMISKSNNGTDGEIL